MNRSLALVVLLLLVETTVASPPLRSDVAVALGPKLFRDGDVVEILDVRSTSPRLEQGDTVVVKGRFRLDSRPAARLCLYLTQTEGDGREETDPTQTIKATSGLHEFELKTTIKHRGHLHITFYDSETGKPFGGVYFGAPDRMELIADWDLGYYLKD